MKKTFYYFFTLLVFMGSIGCSKKSSAAIVGEVKASAYTPDIPVLKGLVTNAILRLNVFVPADLAAQQFTGINCTINTSAIADIESIALYQTSAEPFSTSTPLANSKPTSANFNVPISLKLAPGLHFIWFSVTLSSRANIDQLIELRATDLVQSNGKKLMISQPAGNYAKLKGTAVRKTGDDNVNTYHKLGYFVTKKGKFITG